MQLFLNQLAIGVGAAFPWTSFLFYSQDVFADSIKLTASYRSFLRPDLRWIAPSGWLEPLYELFNSYVQNPVYGDNPIAASTTLTHFMLPPLTQLFFIVSARLLSVFDPLIFLLFSLAVVALPALMAIGICYRRDPELRGEVACLCLISYPFIFALTRGHPIAIASGALIMLSATCYGLENKKAAVLLSIVAVSFRPNLFPITVFYLISDCRIRLRERFGNLAGYAVVGLAWTFLLYKIVHHLYPSYNVASFLEGYSYYSRGEEEANGFAGIGSSLYGAQRVLLATLGLYGPVAPLILKKLNLIVGLVFSLLIAIDCSLGRTTRIRGLFLTILAVLIETPLLADYHLIPFLALFVCPGPCAPNAEDEAAFRGTQYHQKHDQRIIFSGILDRIVGDLSGVEKAALCLMLVPLAYYLVPSRLVSIGAFLRPLMSLICLALWLIPRLKTRVLKINV